MRLTGTCIQRTGTDSDIALKCLPAHKTFNDDLLQSSSNATYTSSVNLLSFALRTRRHIFVGTPAVYPIAGVLFLISLLLLIPLELSSRAPSPPKPKTMLLLNHGIITLFWASVAWSFAGAISVVQAIRAQQEILIVGGRDDLNVQMGVVVQFLQWTAFVASFVFAAGITGTRVTRGERRLNEDEVEYKKDTDSDIPYPV